MTQLRFKSMLLVIGLGALAAPAPTSGQDFSEEDKKQQIAFLKIQKLFDEVVINTAPLQEELPLTKFLSLVEKQMPKDKMVPLRLDRDAFGDKLAEVEATKITMPEFSRKSSLRSVLDIARSQIKSKTDYRLDGAGITITTPARALFTLQHDIRDVVANPEAVGLSDPAFRNADQAKRASLLVKRLVSMLDGEFSGQETIEILNGTRISIRTVGTRQLEFAQALHAFARLGDLAVKTQCKLYEVDDAFYTKLKNAKRIPIEEQERIFLEGKQPKGVALADFLAKQKLILTGDDVPVKSGLSATLLSRQELHQCLPGPNQLAKGDKARQTFLTGIAFSGAIEVSPDRRFVRMKLTENAVELQGIDKIRVRDNVLSTEIVEFGKAPKQKEVFGDVPVLIESTQTRRLEIPDGGTILLPVQHRPRSLEERKRWHVLVISPRIIIEEEERHILHTCMEEAIPALVTDVLNNARLKTTRDYCGTPGDKRFALVDSETWTWPKESRPKVAGFELTPAKAAGKRLLGVRIDGYRWGNVENATSLSIRVSLVNVGGSDNGPAIGARLLSYNARSGEKGWSVQLVEP